MRFPPALTAILALSILAAAPAHASWLRAESPHFVVYGDTTERQVRQQAQLLEDFHGALRHMTSVDPEMPVARLDVYLVHGSGQLNAIRAVGGDAVSLYVATPHGILAAVDVRVRDVGDELLLRNYAHHFLRQHSFGGYPAWFDLGFADYFSTLEIDGDHVVVGKTPLRLVEAFSDGNWLPMDTVLFGSPSDLDPASSRRFMAQSWLAVHYFNSTNERREKLRRYLVAVLADAEPREAFGIATGFTAQSFQAELRTYLRGNLSGLRLARESARAPANIRVSRLPPSAGRLQMHRAALQLGITEQRQASQLEQIRRAAARHRADPYARRVLAHAEALYGDPAVADQLLDPLLAARPNDAELLYLKGMRHFVAAERGVAKDEQLALAREWFGRAHQADGKHFQTLLRYSQTLKGDPRYLSQNNANVTLLALDLAPQVPEVRHEAALVMLGRGDVDGAVAVMRPMMYDLHRPTLSNWARGRIEWMRAQAPAKGQADES